MQYDPEAIRQAMNLAQSPQGQQLIKMLQAKGGSDLQKAMNKATSGDYSAAKETLGGILKDPSVRELLQQLGGNYGQNGR